MFSENEKPQGCQQNPENAVNTDVLIDKLAENEEILGISITEAPSDALPAAEAVSISDTAPWYAKEKPKQHFTDIFSKSEAAAQIFVILLTSVVRAISVNVFANPNKLSLGGVTGIGTILYNALGWDIAITTFVMNIPLLILAFIFINKRFAVLTLLATLATSLFMWFLNVIPVFDSDPFVAALMSGILTGVAVGLMFRFNCSTGGTDIIGLLVQNKFPNAKVVWLIFVLNLLTGVAAGLVFKSVDIVIYSFIAIISSSYATDLLQRGLISTFEVKVITCKPKEISDYVINVLHRSTTQMKIKGMYTGEEHDYLICIIRKRQLSQLKRAIKIIDENSFMYITSVYDTIGRGFNNVVAPKSKIK